MKKLTGLLVLSICFLITKAQKVKTTSGNEDILKSETTINIEFNYDNLSVGKFKKIGRASCRERVCLAV